ncbi:flagellar basal body protein [Massilia sp. WF1]|uniref:flagellar basal body rod protein FlgB n=1 Tax=Massilia sp. WF1 TaxID=1406431 RepID=UPI0009EC4172|nr:flagellar basal body protein [Massilia sp. WF1]
MGPFSGQAKPKFHERALGLRAYRQELLASNIENSDTPGYKTVDIDINTAIKSGRP